MPRFLLEHRHEPCDCPAVFAAWDGYESPLRHRAALGSCPFGIHAIWWAVEAAGPAQALSLLPFFVAERTTPTRVAAVDIP